MENRKWFLPATTADGVMTIPDPHTKEACPAQGKWVSASDEYWIRRELDGGGTLLDAPPAGAEHDDS